ncbi:Hypothetical protein, putative [Bodo saltans]|uniref:Uncharacterized protein n=1 Tax=Bodo saltans TaxID=75058 RepID=A0A0S4J0N4_BODSA|nr:Hypothetical protein, putative [Bodo saltans]|eukprot:CUG77602.1 Hypothetical protein, putative [Bodo saltans]
MVLAVVSCSKSAAALLGNTGNDVPENARGNRFRDISLKDN